MAVITINSDFDIKYTYDFFSAHAWKTESNFTDSLQMHELKSNVIHRGAGICSRARIAGDMYMYMPVLHITHFGSNDTAHVELQ